MISTDWPFWLAAALLGLLSLFTLYRALFHNRSRGRKRCPKCWYDMSGADASRPGGLVCPECGRDARREKRLLRTRRSKRWAVVGAALALIACGVFMAPRVRRDGVLKSVPTTALIVGLAWFDPPSVQMQTNVQRGGAPPKSASALDRAYFELAQRATLDRSTTEADGRWWTWQRRLLWWAVLQKERRSIAQFGPSVCPILVAELFHHRRSDAYADRVYIELRANDLIEIRTLWPEGTPVLYALWPRSLYMLEGAAPREIEVRPRIAGAAPKISVLRASSPGMRPAWLSGSERLVAGAMPVGRHRIEFEVDVREGDRTLWRGVVARMVEVGGAIEDVLLTVESDAARAAILELPAAIHVCEETGRTMLRVELWRSSELYAALPGVALGVRAEVINNSGSMTVFRAGEVPAAHATAWTRFDSGKVWPLAWNLPLASGVDWSVGAPPTLRLTSDPIAALSAFGATSCWSGEVELPLTIIPCAREDFDALFKVGGYLLHGEVDPWTEPVSSGNE